MFHSIRWRLILSYILLTLLAVGAVGALTYQIVDTTMTQQESNSLHANAEAVAAQAESLMWPIINHFELSQLAETAAFLGNVRVRILDSRQVTIVDSGKPGKSGQVMFVLPFGDMDLVPRIEDVFSGMVFYQLGSESNVSIPQDWLEELPPGASITFIQRYEEPWGRHFSFERVIPVEDMPVEVQAEFGDDLRSATVVNVPIGKLSDPIGYVELSDPPAYSIGVLGELRQALVTAGIGGVVLAGVVGLWVSSRLASPLKNLARTSAQMGAGNLSVRAEVKSRGEIGELARQFNQMAERLETSFQQLADERDALRRFITDASHELRTPITALKNFNSLLLGAAADDPPTRTEFLNESSTQIQRLEWITSNLLDLSRLDAGLMVLDRKDLDLRGIVESVAGTFKPLATEAGIRLSTTLHDYPCILSCDRSRIEMAIANILDNALKYTARGGEVEIGIDAQDDIQVWVRDTGAGISPEDLPYIFDRFYRGRDVPGRDHAAEGSGLGLAIVKSIVEAHGGQVSVESVVSEGTTIRFGWN